MALLWPEHAWSGPGRGRDPGRTATHQSYRVWERRSRESCTHEGGKKKTHERTNMPEKQQTAPGCWVTGVKESGNYFPAFFFSLSLPFSHNPSFRFKEIRPPPTHVFENIPFPSTFPSPNFKKPAADSPPSASPLSCPPVSYSQLGRCLESQALSARAIYITWLQNAFAQFSNYSIMPWSSGSLCRSHFLPFTQAALDV